MRVRYSYLPQQFAEIDGLIEEIRRFIPTGDFTLGKALTEFENRFAELIGVEYAIGVGSGTDALKLGLKAVGVGYGDEVITAANTFIATVGAINEIGARPVFVDCDDTFCMDVRQVEQAITSRTRAIMPVHFTGYMTDMPALMEIARRHGLRVIEDACQGILASIGGKNAGTWGDAGGFSLHPLKNLNVWGDGGVVVTNDPGLDRTLRLLRNHGMRNRDEYEILGYNSRLDTLQAIVGNWLIGETRGITAQRITNAAYYDEQLSRVPQIRIPPRISGMQIVYHLYIVFAEDRDGLYEHCQSKGVECKIHYPIPLYQQDCMKFLGYNPGDFPVTDRHTREIITFPVDQHISRGEQDYVIDTVRNYYA
ncbi:MAG: DegT/DnrJ/EryC1/StrS family aminotransferase [Rhodospirillaceae bacterium]|jgi:dTDP-3-amino-2,3,6-trideoxy-4-keto-D-glucose/dTDP-3-amino-3,4,6-trideoxy-alpha-D-glucose/dTDP-2,6-dideoxy-D-kanosamine transaminase|nr:DegT/DnrJ/EryC1/StrS family aminotransferase [Rhodospirillaceae bacterium]